MARFAVETVFSAVDRLTAPVRKMGKRIGKMTRKVEVDLRNLSAATDKLGRDMLAVGRTAAIGLGAPLASLGAFVTIANRGTTEVNKMSKAVGVSASTVDALAFAFRGTEFSTDNVIDLVEEMNNKLGESAGLEEITPVTESLAILGLEFEKLRDLSPEEQFKAITNAALGMEDAQKAASAADILLGGEANKMIGIMRQQGRTFEEVTAAGLQYSFMTDRAREGADAFTDSTSKTTKIVTSLSNQFAGLLGEVLSPLIERMNEWLLANKEFINLKVQETVDAISKGLNFFADNLDSIILVLKSFATAIAVFGALSVLLRGAATAMTIFNIVTGKNPIVFTAMMVGKLVIALASLGVGLFTLVGGWEGIGNAIKSALQWLQDFFALGQKVVSEVIDKVAGIGGSIVEGAKSLIFGSDSPDPKVAGPLERSDIIKEQQQVDVRMRAEAGTSASMTTTGRNRAGKTVLENSGSFA